MNVLLAELGLALVVLGFYFIFVKSEWNSFAKAGLFCLSILGAYLFGAVSVASDFPFWAQLLLLMVALVIPKLLADKTNGRNRRNRAYAPSAKS